MVAGTGLAQREVEVRAAQVSEDENQMSVEGGNSKAETTIASSLHMFNFYLYNLTR